MFTLCLSAISRKNINQFFSRPGGFKILHLNLLKERTFWTKLYFTIDYLFNFWMNSIKVKKINFILFGTFEYFLNIHPNLFLVSCAGEIFWDTCFHSYSPNIILRKDKFSQQHFKKISQTLWKSRTLLILNSYTDILPKIFVTFWVISDNFWKF